jgi:hypothetical protein
LDLEPLDQELESPLGM